MIYRREGSKYWYAAVFLLRPDGTRWKLCRSTGTTDENEARMVEQSMIGARKAMRERRKVEDILDTMVRQMGAAVPAVASGYPLSKAWEAFAKLPRNRETPGRTIAAKRQAWNRLAEWLKANHPDAGTMQDVSPRIAAEFLGTMPGAATHNRTKAYLSSMWKELAISAGLDGNPWRQVGAILENAKSYRPFALDEVRAILGKCDAVSPYWRHLVAVGYFTGMREGDCVTLARSEITPDGFIEKIPSKTRRTGKAIRIFIHPDLQRILAPIIAAMPADADLLFPDAAAKYGTQAFGLEFGEILKAAKVKETKAGRVSFHSLRHSMVTTLEAAGVDRRTVQGIVGHGSDAMTARYSHVLDASRILAKVIPALNE